MTARVVPITQVIRHEHQTLPETPSFHVKIERNSKGHNIEISYSGPDLDAVLSEIDRAYASLADRYPAGSLSIAS